MSASTKDLKQTVTTSFNVTFVDKDDTRIYSVQKDRVDQKIFYNCGDRNFSFAINGYFNGPNYELKPMLKVMMPHDYYF